MGLVPVHPYGLSCHLSLILSLSPKFREFLSCHIYSPSLASSHQPTNISSSLRGKREGGREDRRRVEEGRK